MASGPNQQGQQESPSAAPLAPPQAHPALLWELALDGDRRGWSATRPVSLPLETEPPDCRTDTSKPWPATAVNWSTQPNLDTRAPSASLFTRGRKYN